MNVRNVILCEVECTFDIYYSFVERSPGGRLNKKDGLTRYGDSHVKDKTS